MIGYTTLGTNDLQRAAKFYDELFALLDAKRMMDTEKFIMWGTGFGKPAFAMTLPYNGDRATVGNGVMVALAASSPAVVDAVYKKVLELGGTDEGPPGERFPGFYAAYFRDPEGNKLNAFHMSPSAMGGA